MHAPLGWPWWRDRALAFAAFLAIAVALQWRGGAYAADLAGYSDEASHYVTGLMVRDYVLAFPWTSPLAFARTFYNHYPAVAIGHWPPLFYIVQAAWMLPFGDSPAAVLVLIAAISAATATLLFAAWRSILGTAAAAALAIAFLATPIVQEWSRGVMSEMLVTLLVVAAALIYARYLQTLRARDAVWFGLVASAAILTKPVGLALGLLPPIAAILARRPIAATRSFWIPALIVVPLCAPWYVLTSEMARTGWSASYSPAWLLRNPATENAIQMVRLAGPPAFVLAVLGMFLTLGRRTIDTAAPDRHAHWTVMLALIVSSWVFCSFILPVREIRHLLPALPAILGFAGGGIVRIAHGPGWRRIAAAALVVMLVVSLARATGIRKKPDLGTASAVEAILARPDRPGTVVLVSSEGYGEGVFIAALAAGEARPGHYVLRASKVLSTSDWSGSDYRLTHATPADADRALRAIGVEAIVIDTHPAAGPHSLHHRQLLTLIRDFPQHWEALPATDVPGNGFKVFTAVHDGT